MSGDMPGRTADRYRLGDVTAVVAAELDALGSDFGANGYTTMAQAEELGDLLALAPDRVLLDLGSGCGWPGIHLARRSGCRLISIDPIDEGVRRTAARAEAEGLMTRSLAVLGTGERLPVASGTVDAVVHGDVLC